MPISKKKLKLINEIGFARDVLAELRGYDLRPPLNRNADLLDKDISELQEILDRLCFNVGLETLNRCQERDEI